MKNRYAHLYDDKPRCKVLLRFKINCRTVGHRKKIVDRQMEGPQL